MKSSELMEEKKILSFAERMKQKALAQKNYGHELETGNGRATLKTISCPNCGAGRAVSDGLTHCAFCGFEFISAVLTDGLYTTSKNNSDASDV